MSTTDLPGSSLLAGRYRLVERLGAGGMSVVWRGFDEVLGRQVAVKVLPPSTGADPAFRRRLRAEAQAAARLTHPNITNVYDYGEAVTAGGEPVPYVVMELIDGESLAAVLARTRRLPWPHAVRITAEVAAGLAAAHSRGIVHRDVTPANVMLTPAGAKVVDFGISALIGANDIDPDGSLLGTPAYLAPERLEGGQVSPATDVYAVGLLIYRTLIGQLPWDVGTTTELLRAHQYIEPDPLPPVEGLPVSVSSLVRRCLEKRPSDRPSSAELAHALAGIAAGAPADDRDYVSGSGEDTTILPVQRSYPDVIRVTATPVAPEAGTHHIRRVLAATGVLLFGAGCVWTLSVAGGPERRVGAPQPRASVLTGDDTCLVSYAVWSDADHRFTSQVTVTNRDDTPMAGWRLWFVMPGDQVVTGAGAATLTQRGNAVSVRSSAPLGPQATVRMPIRGRYRMNNAAPMAFTLNERTCRTFVSATPGAPPLPVERLPAGDRRALAVASVGTPVPLITASPRRTPDATPTPSSPVVTSAPSRAPSFRPPPPEPSFPPATTEPATTEPVTPSTLQCGGTADHCVPYPP